MSVTYSIIYVNYYSLKWIRDSIKSLIKHHPANDFEVIIVSNSAWDTDDVRGYLKTSIPVKLQLLSDNPGFAAANNQGAALAEGEYLLFLNPDTIVENDILNALRLCFEQSPRSGAAGPKTVYGDGSLQHTVKRRYDWRSSIGLMVTGLGALMPKFFGHAMKPKPKTYTVDVINGSAMFMSRTIFDLAGGFNSSLFMYWEEDDMCRKITSAGYFVWYCHEALITHFEGKTGDPFNEKLTTAYQESKQTYLMDWNPRIIRFDNMCSVIGYSFRWFYYTVTGNKTQSEKNRTIVRFNFRALFNQIAR